MILMLYHVSCLLVLFLTSQVNYIYASSLPSSNSSSSMSLCHPDQGLALLQLTDTFSSTGLDICHNKYYYRPRNYLKTNYWAEGTDCCKWDGVTCDLVTGHVIGLDLSCCGFFGPIHPNNSLFRLTHLQKLNLALNDFESSNIPSEFGRFSRMTHLDLSSNNLSLEKSVWEGMVQNLSEIRNIYLDGVKMSSIGPNSMMNLSSTLTSLSLSECGLSGKFPENVLRLPHLQMLNLESNEKLMGYLPKSNWSSPLKHLNVQGTKFSGEIPETIGNLKSLMILNLKGCNFNRSIPTSFWTLTKLTYLYLSFNYFTGSIPTALGNLTQITYLDLSSNYFTGSILTSLGTLTQITYLDLSSNYFTGSIPSSLSNLKVLVYFLLSANDFNGRIPDIFTNLTLLYKVNLSSNLLSETLPSSLFTLPLLEELDLSNNQLTCLIDQFPNALRNMDRLTYLDLSNNRIYGQIPKWMFDVGKYLAYLDLSHNFLSSIKQLPWENLQYLDLRANKLQGAFPIPPPSVELFFVSNNSLIGEIPSLVCNLSYLLVLDISYNHLNGTIPQCLGNISQTLSVLDLRMNSFHGTIPKTFAKCDSLRNLDFNGNQLRGPLPRSLANCSSLEVLDLGNNKINDSFPFWLEDLQNLQVFVLRSNRFHGHIGNSNTKFPFPKLRILDLSYNEFNGPLPTNYFENFKAMMVAGEGESNLRYMGEYYYRDSVAVTMKGLEVKLVRILTTFTTIDLSSNKFQGQIPKVLGNLNFLRLLNLSHNCLTNHIPSSLGNLSVLESLDLSSNRLVGKIPMQLTSLTFLAVLNLSKNQLEGPIPQGKQFGTFQNDSYGGNLGLCGFPLSKKCSIDELPSPSPPSIFQEGNNSGFVSGFGWKVVVLGYGCGIVFGLVMGYFVFKIGKPQWLVRFVEEEQYRMVKSFNRRRGKRRNKCM